MDLIQMAREMGKALQATEEYKRFEAARKANDEDQSLQDGIGDFNLKRMKMSQEMQKEEKDEKKLQELNEELQRIYTEVMGNANMMEYNIAKQELDEMMQKVNAILSMCVNGEDPDTCEIPEHNCTGSCATCGGCH
ncbi:MAG: YlbF family regulator [Candidatus Merdivicinus sp.]|jgi:cell fate (sporulation/competence/biofilm development) regulator YlbF (YheA/YmcA/DUF963 family)